MARVDIDKLEAIQAELQEALPEPLRPWSRSARYLILQRRRFLKGTTE